MTKRRIAIALCALILCIFSPMAVYASIPAKSAQPPTGGSGAKYLFAEDVYCGLSVGGGTARATADYSLKVSGVTVTVKLVIQQKAPGGSWTQAASTSGSSVSCSTISGYQYRATATFTFKKNGQSETATASAGPYTA